MFWFWSSKCSRELLPLLIALLLPLVPCYLLLAPLVLIPFAPVTVIATHCYPLPASQLLPPTDSCSIRVYTVSLLLFMMWPPRIYALSVWTWILVSSILQPCTEIHQYTADELLRLRFSLAAPPPAVLHLHADIFFLSCRGYIHGILIKIILSNYNLSGPPLATLDRTLAGLLTTMFG